MFIQLFDSVNVTRGVKNSIITDSQNGYFSFIPNYLCDLLINKDVNYIELEKQLDCNDKKTLKEYLNFIVDNNLGIIIETEEELNCFHKSYDYYEKPFIVDYILLDLKIESSFDPVLIKKIVNINARYLQIRIINDVNVEKIELILNNLKLFNSSNIHEISIILPYNELLYTQISNENYFSTLNRYLHLTFYGAEEDNFQNYGSIIINKIKKKLKIPLSCGVVDLKNVNLNRDFHLESLNFNTCLHRKISIDQEGNIKNCPSMPQSFGNIKDTTLEEALNHKDFKKYWNLTKDSIEVCKDCEFRYICTDCRAYTERTHTNEEGLDISKPLKCGYNPYTGEWEEWSTNPLKEKAIQFYGMQDLVKKK